MPTLRSPQAKQDKKILSPQDEMQEAVAQGLQVIPQPPGDSQGNIGLLGKLFEKNMKKYDEGLVSIALNEVNQGKDAKAIREVLADTLSGTTSKKIPTQQQVQPQQQQQTQSGVIPPPNVWSTSGVNQQGQAYGDAALPMLLKILSGQAGSVRTGTDVQEQQAKTQFYQNKGQQFNPSPDQLGATINAYNEALPEGYQASYGAGGKIMASKPGSYATATDKSNLKATVEGVAKGTVPPDPTKIASRRDLTNITGELAKKGLDLKQLSLDYQAEQSFIKSINSTQQVRLRQLIPSVLSGIDDLDSLNDQFKRTGVKAFNKATVEYFANGGGTKEQQEIAQKFVSQMTVLADEMGSIFMGGNTPTDRSLNMAQQLFKGDFNDTALKASNEQVKRNLGYRQNAIESVQPIGTEGTVGEVKTSEKKKENKKNNKIGRFTVEVE
jgi:hypothetical protein